MPNGNVCLGSRKPRKLCTADSGWVKESEFTGCTWQDSYLRQDSYLKVEPCGNLDKVLQQKILGVGGEAKKGNQ